MQEAIFLHLNWRDWLGLFTHLASLSLVAVGGAITVLSAIHLYLVDEHGWLSEKQFNASYALAQASPGPNVLYIAVFGWMIGINSGSMMTGLLGVMVMLSGMLLPSSTLTYFASRWLEKNQRLRSVRAFRQGMLPIVIALMLSAAWLLVSAHNQPAKDWSLWLTSVVAALLVWRTRIHLLWLLLGGAILGWMGFI